MSESGDPIHIRTLRCEASRVGQHELEVTGRLLDERPGGGRWFGIEGERVIHDMRITLRVRVDDLVITAAEAHMDARPYTVCTDAVPALRQLVGLSVARGFTRAVNERLGRERGCAHLTALVQAMAPVIRQAAGACRDETEALHGDQWFVDSCQAWRAGGALHRRLAAGDVEGLRALSTLTPADGGAAQNSQGGATASGSSRTVGPLR